MRGRGRVRLQGINTASIEYLQQVCSVYLEGIGCKSAVRRLEEQYMQYVHGDLQ